MRSLRALLLLGLAATLAFSPAPQDVQQKFVDEVNKRADLLRRERQALEAVCKAQETNLREIVEDWQRGFDPALIKPVADNAESLYEKQVAALTAQMNVKRTYPELEAEAKKQKWTDHAKVKGPLSQCKTAYDLARPYLYTTIDKSPYGKLAAHYKVVRQRIADAAKGGSNNASGEMLIVVSDDPKDVQGDIKDRVGENTVFYRTWGAKNFEFGSWWTDWSPKSAEDARTKLALPPDNYCTDVTSVTFMKGTKLIRSTATPLFGHKGGAEQYFFDSSKNGGNYADRRVERRVGKSTLKNR